MLYSLFLDDERFPPDDPFNDVPWVLARTYEDAVWYVENYGMPHMFSFDHDLGLLSKNGYQFAQWVGERMMDRSAECRKPIYYTVHSMNPVGAENIRRYLNRVNEIIEKEMPDVDEG